LALVVCAFATLKPHDRRLVKLSEDTEPQWITFKELLDLRQANVGLFDITEFVDTPRFKIPSPPPLPSKPQQQTYVNKAIPSLSTDNMEANVNALSSFYTRFYSSTTGVQAAEWIFDKVTEYAQGRNDITISFFNSTTTAPQPSVIAHIKGKVSDDLVILGSHEDSINIGGFGRAPGVDDDGSGTVSVLEVFKALMENNFRPNRTVEFHFYAAEEVGLKGSQAIAKSYASEGKNVVGMMQLDMVFYAGDENVFGVVVDYVDPDLTQFTRDLVDEYSLIKWVNTVCGYGCSDHASWTSEGYRSTFPFETQFEKHNPYIHSADDTLEHASLAHGLEFAKVALGFVVELAATDYN
jgi:leucyl aminopeptidase